MEIKDFKYYYKLNLYGMKFNLQIKNNNNLLNYVLAVYFIHTI